MDDTPKPVIDGEIIEDPKEDVPQEVSSVVEDDAATVLLSLEEMIKSNIASIDRMQEEATKLKEMLADGFNNDAIFKQASDKVKEANKTKSAARQQIMNRPGMIDIANKAKSTTSEIKEKKAALSDYLLEYTRMAEGVNEIEGYDGEVREMVHHVKLVKKSKPQK